MGKHIGKWQLAKIQYVAITVLKFFLTLASVLIINALNLPYIIKVCYVHLGA